MEIAKKTTIITGVSSGLGAALTIAFVVKGGTVYGLARNAEMLQKQI